ncbi:hypothetical protein L202_02198 [Cryptococcus amylolentus CBS 6039]|uniref:Uncharacterized protein n=1 Tax=Cryptococcus amylolentus CBS 6039 TaxID=1295533 RepID=A0A1E3HZP6_9TREE|nr:hypothetical protein L202_02198 [Cryptococcus amylolentus CBS 6039]ODN81834.1 hypothetical protein L202_02198 [Cryptococcus amylolentus CBS 6039]
MQGDLHSDSDSSDQVSQSSEAAQVTVRDVFHQNRRVKTYREAGQLSRRETRSRCGAQGITKLQDDDDFTLCHGCTACSEATERPSTMPDGTECFRQHTFSDEHKARRDPYLDESTHKNDGAEYVPRKAPGAKVRRTPPASRSPSSSPSLPSSSMNHHACCSRQSCRHLKPLLSPASIHATLEETHQSVMSSPGLLSSCTELPPTVVSPRQHQWTTSPATKTPPISSQHSSLTGRPHSWRTHNASRPTVKPGERASTPSSVPMTLFPPTPYIPSSPNMVSAPQDSVPSQRSPNRLMVPPELSASHPWPRHLDWPPSRRRNVRMPSRMAAPARARNPLLVLPLPCDQSLSLPVVKDKVEHTPVSSRPSGGDLNLAVPPDLIIEDTLAPIGIIRFQDVHDYHTYYRCSACSLTGCYRGKLADDPTALNFHLSSDGHNQSVSYYMRSRSHRQGETRSTPCPSIIAPIPLRPFSGARSPLLLKRQLSEDQTNSPDRVSKSLKVSSSANARRHKEGFVSDDHPHASLETWLR